jgi:hypothetical protein
MDAPDKKKLFEAIHSVLHKAVCAERQSCPLSPHVFKSAPAFPRLMPSLSIASQNHTSMRVHRLLVPKGTTPQTLICIPSYAGIT